MADSLHTKHWLIAYCYDSLHSMRNQAHGLMVCREWYLALADEHELQIRALQTITKEGYLPSRLPQCLTIDEHFAKASTSRELLVLLWYCPCSHNAACALTVLPVL
jgi:hypothetical protein